MHPVASGSSVNGGWNVGRVIACHLSVELADQGDAPGANGIIEHVVSCAHPRHGMNQFRLRVVDLAPRSLSFRSPRTGRNCRV